MSCGTHRRGKSCAFQILYWNHVLATCAVAEKQRHTCSLELPHNGTTAAHRRREKRTRWHAAVAGHAFCDEVEGVRIERIVVVVRRPRLVQRCALYRQTNHTTPHHTTDAQHDSASQNIAGGVRCEGRVKVATYT
jgi:hypothetical protein